MRMAEENATTGRLTAERAQTFQLIERMAARVMGLLFASGALALSAWLATTGYETLASVIAGTTVLGITAALITGKSP